MDHLLEITLEFPGHRDQRRRLRDQALAESGRLHAVPIPVEEARTDRLLEILEAAGQGRLGKPDGFGGPGEVAVAIECEDVPQLPEVELHARKLSEPLRKLIGPVGLGQVGSPDPAQSRIQ